ncbi:hypothetical protein M404DRAFT_751139 [Pisolithus tinctorius Marx 270]|uniref:Uncharacterized protein n=1 Tax=Pisolithus tinctorius Marx 270 TaxID=870435 RepID=A0A0C3PU48_PISTI|nr:hypothetical protein M404DRAFT_751139 [Pisolithus tinctorius Marx 270]
MSIKSRRPTFVCLPESTSSSTQIPTPSFASAYITVTMPNNIQADAQVIISSALNGIGGNPYVGVSLILPTILPVNLIPRTPGVQPPVVRIIVPPSTHDEYSIISLSSFVQFVFKRVEGNIYTITTNGMQVIELEGRLVAGAGQTPEEWVIKYRELQDAYT